MFPTLKGSKSIFDGDPFRVGTGFVRVIRWRCHRLLNLSPSATLRCFSSANGSPQTCRKLLMPWKEQPRDQFSPAIRRSGATSSSTIQPAPCTSRAIVRAKRMSVLSALPAAPL